MCRCRDVIVLERTRQIGCGDKSQQTGCGRIDPACWNLVSSERLSGGRADELDRACREIAEPHRIRWTTGVLVESGIRFACCVVELKVRSAVLILIEMRNLHGAAKRRAEIVSAELRLPDRHIRAQLIGR